MPTFAASNILHANDWHLPNCLNFGFNNILCCNTVYAANWNLCNAISNINAWGIFNYATENIYAPNWNLFSYNSNISYLAYEPGNANNTKTIRANLYGWRFDNLNSINSIFYHQYNLIELNIENWYMPKIQYINKFFSGATKIYTSENSLRSICNFLKQLSPQLIYHNLNYQNTTSPFDTNNLYQAMKLSYQNELIQAGYTW